MTRTKSIYLALLAVLLSPMAANAGLISFTDATNDADPDLLSADPCWSYTTGDFTLGCSARQNRSLALQTLT